MTPPIPGKAKQVLVILQCYNPVVNAGLTAAHSQSWTLPCGYLVANLFPGFLLNAYASLTTCVNTASAWGSQKVMSMARYNALAADSAACA
jgi:hypothetical protein